LSSCDCDVCLRQSVDFEWIDRALVESWSFFSSAALWSPAESEFSLWQLREHFKKRTGYFSQKTMASRSHFWARIVS
jgi:hypothetical protein